jgi:glycosyltransferase involved in cell wall biosynthesis
VTEGARRPSVATGKLFEYLATSRPILVLGAETEAGRIVVSTGRGVATSADDPRAIANTLRQVAAGEPTPVADEDEVQQYSWPVLADAYADLVEQVCSR